MQKSFWIIQAAPVSNDKCFYESEAEGSVTDTERRK